MDNRRAAPRCDVFTRIGCRGQSVWGTDLSPRGFRAGFRYGATGYLELGSYYPLEFKLPHLEPMRVDSQVVRIDDSPDGLQFGLRFCRPRPEVVNQLGRFVDERTARWAAQAVAREAPPRIVDVLEEEKPFENLLMRTFKGLRARELQEARREEGVFVPTQELWTLSRMLGRFKKTPTPQR